MSESKKCIKRCHKNSAFKDCASDYLVSVDLFKSVHKAFILLMLDIVAKVLIMEENEVPTEL